MIGFLTRQLDAVTFGTSLAFMVLALGAFWLVRAQDRFLPWKWLGFSALAAGLGEWQQLVFALLGGEPASPAFGLLLPMVAAVFLGKFALAGWAGLGRRQPGRWLLWVAIGLAAAGGLWGLPGLQAGVYWGLILPVHLAAGLVWWLTVRQENWRGILLRLVGVGLVLAALSLGLSWPLPADIAILIPAQEAIAGTLALVGIVLRSLFLWLTVICFWLSAMELAFARHIAYPSRIRYLLSLGTVGAFLIIFLLGGLLTNLFGKQAQKELWALNWQRLRHFELLWQNELMGGQSLAEAVAGTAQVQLALASGQAHNLMAANQELDRFCATFPGTLIYLMNLEGLTVASSNRLQADSFVGKSYAFRPYFQQARLGRNGSYMGLGATSRERGLYTSAPVFNAAGKLVGVAVVKKAIDRIEAFLAKDSLLMLASRHGIIFLASRPTLVLKSLWPLPPQQAQEVIASRQFGAGPFPALLSQEPTSGTMTVWEGQTWLCLIKRLTEGDWQVVVLGSIRSIQIARSQGLGITLFFFLTAVGLFMVWDTILEASARIGVSERLYQSLVVGAPDCIALFDQEGKFLTVNPNGAQMLGRPAAEVLGLTLAHLCHPAQRSLVGQALHKVLQGDKTVFEMSYRHPAGHTLGLQVILNPILESDGRVNRFVGILSDITDRQKTEASLQFRVDLEALIARISTDFINLPPEDIDAGINRALATLGSFVGVDRAYVFQLHDHGRLASNTHEWCAPGIGAEQANLQNLLLEADFPWFTGLMRRFEVCSINQVADLPAAAAAEQAEFKRQGIQSLVVVPMVHQGDLVGFLGFDAVRQARVWHEDTVTLLKMVADILVNALARQRDSEALRLDESRLETLIHLGQMQDRPFQEIVNFALEEAVRLTRSQVGYLAFVNDSETHLTRYAWSLQTMQLCGIDNPPLIYEVEKTGLWGEAFRQRRPVITNDYAAPHPAKKGLPEGHVPIHRHLNIPVFEGSHIVAVAGVGNKQDPYDDADVRQLTLLMDGMWKLIQRKKADEALAAEKERLAVTLSSIGDAVIATDTHGNIHLMNHVAEELTGWPQETALGQPVLTVCRLSDANSHQPQSALIPQILAGQSLAGQSFLLQAADGRERLIAASGAPIIDLNRQVQGAVLVLRDITLQRSFEEELLKIAKLRSLGLLAGGIAHDFNNILTAILGNLSLGILQLEAPQGNGNLKERLREAEKATLRARNLVQRLLTFAKGGAPVKRLASLQDIVTESATFASSGSASLCKFHLPNELWAVEVDEGQISQVIQNLVINAAQAMPTGGNIILAAANVTLAAASGLPLPAGRYVKLTVTDQGIGIPPEHVPHIFDPYFSTKQHGSGLGLATVYAIVSNHEGHITVVSQLGLGTTFSVYLPASEQQMAPRSNSEPLLLTGQGRILVMDDEAMVREVVARMLQRLGYEAELAADGQEAVDRYQEALSQSRPFAGVILDLTVPGGMGGREAMARLLKIDTHIVSLVSSGYAEDAIMTHYQEYGFRGYIKKPYRLEELSKALHEALMAEKTAACG